MSKGKEFVLVLGGASLLAGLWEGLVRIGWNLPIPAMHWTAIHGVVMVNGFFGTLIGMERAVALNKNWGYLGPILSGLGSILLLVGSSFGAILMLISSIIFLVMNIAFVKRQAEDFVVGGLIGALAWLYGNGIWLTTGSISDATLPWIGFFVLTISAERLGLSRFTNRPDWAKIVFWIPIALVLLAGIIPKSYSFDVVGFGLIGIALWLIKYDIVRQNLRQKGLAKFSSLALISGYFWLMVGGVIAIISSPNFAGPLYDAIVHSVMIGFVFSMVFAHAPIVLPSVVGINRKYHNVLHLPLWLLHFTLMLRIVGDLLIYSDLRLIGAMGNAISVVLFILLFAIIPRK